MAGDISNLTTNFSNVSVEGILSANTVMASAQSLTGLAASQVSSIAVGTTATIGTSLALAGGTTITGLRKGTISVVTLTCTANGSTVTQATVSPLATSDILLVSPQSSLSSGVVVHAYVSAASTVQVVFSNMSTASNVIGGPCVLNYVAIRS